MWLTTCIEFIFIKYLGVDIYQIVVSYENDSVSVNHVCVNLGTMLLGTKAIQTAVVPKVSDFQDQAHQTTQLE